MHPSLLQNISQPRDLKRLNSAQIQQLCGEIRQFLLDSVSKTGGHLASNLGAVELTVAAVWDEQGNEYPEIAEALQVLLN